MSIWADMETIVSATLSIWADIETIVSATLSGDINFKVVQAYRSNAAWFIFGGLTLFGAGLFYGRQSIVERIEAKLGLSITNITHPLIAVMIVWLIMDGMGVTGVLLSILPTWFAIVMISVLLLMEKSPERSISIYTYMVIAGIIFIGVIQRFGIDFVNFFYQLPSTIQYYRSGSDIVEPLTRDALPEWIAAQPPWSTTVPPFLFMIMAWFGCSLNVRLRTHLSFSEFRTKFGPNGQLTCLVMDAVLWMGFCIIAVTTTARVTVNSYDNFQIVAGTDNLMVWSFIVTVPVAFIVMAGRVLENLIEDFGNYRRGQPMIKQAVMGGDV